jgi:hypothetical protein
LSCHMETAVAYFRLRGRIRIFSARKVPTRMTRYKRLSMRVCVMRVDRCPLERRTFSEDNH